MKKETKVLIITCVAVITLVLCVVGATYAYFTAQMGSGQSVNINANTATTDSLKFDAGKSLSITANQENFAEGAGNKSDNTIVSAILRANNTTNSATYTYNVYLEILSNGLKYTTEEKTAELLLQIKDPNDNDVTTISGLNYVTIGDVSGFDITESQDLITIASNYEIHAEAATPTAEKTDEWEITIVLVNLGSNQNENTGKQFIANVLIGQEERKVDEYAVLKSPESGFDINTHSNIVFWNEFMVGGKHISRISFEDKAIEHPEAEAVYDFSEAQDNSIKAYMVKNDEDEYYTLYINSDAKMMAPEDSSYWFNAFATYSPDGDQVSFMHSLKEIIGLKNLDTSNVTTMQHMFSGCSRLTSLDLSGWDTSNVTDMTSMFSGCSDLTSLDLTPLDTSNVTFMGGMFSGCSGLTSLDLTPLDTSNVTDMSYMFSGCSSLTSLDFSKATFEKVTDNHNMFYNGPSTINVLVKDQAAKEFIEARLNDSSISGGIVTIKSA